MKRAFFAFVWLCAAGMLGAQEGGLTPVWDIGAVLKEIGAHAGRLVPLLDQADPSGWILKGAPEAYVAQWKSCKEQAAALAGDAAALAKSPETLPGALKVFFRMQSLEFSLNSLGAGIRRYQNPALADLLASVAAENGANRERFQRYIVDLAAQREEEYRIMDHEAQRCRAQLSRQPSQNKNGRK
ncbi:MAG: hypothetical protein ACE15B_21460 [Bryobacteraceae bacterium]